MAAKKFFPIKTETSCKLKWSWTTLRLYNGGASSCHRVKSDIVSVDNFETFHNTAKKLEDRQLMLAGKWPTGGCEYCQQVEAAGGSSDRQMHLKIPDQYPSILDQDATAINVAPTILEVYLDNVCNMSCLYCWDGFSSQIQQENLKFGVFNESGVVIENRAVKHPEHKELKIKYWEWMSKNSQSLSRWNILGGEPFYQKEFELCLDFLENNKHPDLEFGIVSNLMINPVKFKTVISRIKSIVASRKIKRFDITASIDCFGKEQEYVRHGLDLDTWKSNFEFLVSQKWITLNINQTISALTIKTIPALISYINDLNTDRDIGHYMSTTVSTYDFLHPQIFGAGFFDEDFRIILDLMKEDTWQQKEAKRYMQGLISQINTQSRNQVLINQLGTYLTELDRRRNLNWQDTFLWLKKEITNVV